MKVFIVFRTYSNGATWRDEVHCVRESREEAEKALSGLESGYISDYDTAK